MDYYGVMWDFTKYLTKEVDKDLAFDEALSWLAVDLMPIILKSRRFSTDECIYSVTRQAGAGYPFCLKYPSKGEVLDNVPLPFLFRRVHEKCEPAKWLVVGKFELRKSLRVKQRRIRTFVCGPIDHYLAAAHWFGVFKQLFEDLWFSAIGMSIYGAGWDDLASYLGTTGVCSADLVNCDGSVPAWFMLWFFDLFFKYAPQTICEEAFKQFVKDTIEGFVVMPWGDVYVKLKGNPSGWYLTTVINTLWMVVLFYRACVLKNLSYEIVRLRLRLKVFGDDAAWNSFLLTAKDFLDSLSGIGMIAKVNPGPNLEDIEFLSHGFVFDKLWLPSFSAVRAYNSVFRIRNRPTHRLIVHRLVGLITETWYSESRTKILRYLKWYLTEYGDLIFSVVEDPYGLTAYQTQQMLASLEFVDQRYRQRV